MNSLVRSFQTQSLAHLGVSMSEMISLEYPRAYRVLELFHPRTASTLCTPHLAFQPEIVDWLRDKFGGLRTSGGGRRKLFISRARALENHARRLLNEEEISGLGPRTTLRDRAL
jgi:capsular polysaccharide biosynthesis protein